MLKTAGIEVVGRVEGNQNVLVRTAFHLEGNQNVLKTTSSGESKRTKIVKLTQEGNQNVLKQGVRRESKRTIENRVKPSF